MYLKADTKIYIFGINRQTNFRQSFYEQRIEYLYSLRLGVKSRIGKFDT